MIITLFFYIFASFIILGSVGVVISRNSVYSVLWMIFVFCNASGLFVLLGAEFLAMTLVVVYVGAVAVLFLFIVMMIGGNFFDLKQAERQKRWQWLGLFAICVLVIDLTLIAFAEKSSVKFNNKIVSHQTSDINMLHGSDNTNTHRLGVVLYTDFMLPFQVSGIILFVAMIGCIILTLDDKKTRKKQDVSRQLKRSKEDALSIACVPLNQGVNGIKYD